MFVKKRNKATKPAKLKALKYSILHVQKGKLVSKYIKVKCRADSAFYKPVKLILSQKSTGLLLS